MDEIEEVGEEKCGRLRWKKNKINVVGGTDVHVTQVAGMGGGKPLISWAFFF